MTPETELKANEILAAYGMEHHAVQLSLADLLQLEKISYTLPALVRLTSPFSVSKSGGCTAEIFRRYTKTGLFTYKVKCGEPYSKGPHIVRIRLADDVATKYPKDRQVKVSCSCSFWVFWGPDEKAYEKGYLEGPRRTTVPSQGVRDPGKKNWICKHIYVASRLFYKEQLPAVEEMAPDRIRQKNAPPPPPSQHEVEKPRPKNENPAEDMTTTPKQRQREQPKKDQPTQLRKPTPVRQPLRKVKQPQPRPEDELDEQLPSPSRSLKKQKPNQMGRPRPTEQLTDNNEEPPK